MSRFIVGTATAKRIYFIWCEPDWRPSNSANMFAFDSDSIMAVLSSTVHTEWASKKSSTLEDRIRYTPSSAFETFPWPEADEDQRTRIAALGRDLLQRRGDLCAEHEIGLNELYNQVEDGAFEALVHLHRELDHAVVEAFGWETELVHDIRRRNQRLYDLNRAIVEGEAADYRPF